jgi:hypothetical protein
MSKKFTLTKNEDNKKEGETDSWPKISGDERAMIQDIFHKMVCVFSIHKKGQKPQWFH